MNLLKSFRKKMRALGVKSDSRILVAVSGGLDSMVLLHLSANAGYKTEAAHANFKLRGADSEADEDLVRKTAEKLDVEIFAKSLKVDKKTENVQVSARNLRYDWFHELVEKHRFDYILTAHHQDDRIETFFINLLRGSGLKGLKSIPEKNKNILRPLLLFSKGALKAYAEENGIEWREDSSNRETDYLRNKIRHGLAAEFSRLVPAANENLAKSIDFLGDANQYFENTAAVFIHSLKKEKENTLISDDQWSFLFGARPLHKYVFEHFGFISDQLSQLEELSNSQSGRRIESAHFTAYRDRDGFVLEPSDTQKVNPVFIDSKEGELDLPIHLKWWLNETSEIDVSKSHHFAHLDFDKLQFPLTLRKWRPGDRFVPLGMSGSKKISDFLTDQKCSIPQKNQTFVIESAGKICWVVGMRIDNRFKCEARDTTVFTLQLAQPQHDD